MLLVQYRLPKWPITRHNNTNCHFAYHPTTIHITKWRQLAAHDFRWIAFSAGQQWSSDHCSSETQLGNSSAKPKSPTFATKFSSSSILGLQTIHAIIIMVSTNDLMSWWINGGFASCRKATPRKISLIIEYLMSQLRGCTLLTDHYKGTNNDYYTVCYIHCESNHVMSHFSWTHIL